MVVAKSQRHKKQILFRKLRFYVLAAIPLVIAIVFLRGDSGIINQIKLVKKRNDLKKEIQALEEQRAQLKKEIELLQSNSDYIEKFAREEYGLGKPDEMIFMIETEEKKK